MISAFALSYLPCMKPSFLVFILFALQLFYTDTSNAQGKERIAVLKKIPVLCYHNIYKTWKQLNHLYISEQQLNRHLKVLNDSGYTSILPHQLADYYLNGTPLPPKPVLISFDDAHLQHYTIARPLLNQYRMKGIFFVMTVVLNKKGFLTKNQVAQLAEEGHQVGLHTWDHPNLSKTRSVKWSVQLEQPRHLLENVTGQKIACLAYPFGAWNHTVIAEVKKRGIVTAFQLTGAMSFDEPLLTIRRIMVNGQWSPTQLISEMKTRFQ